MGTEAELKVIAFFHIAWQLLLGRYAGIDGFLYIYRGRSAACNASVQVQGIPAVFPLSWQMMTRELGTDGTV